MKIKTKDLQLGDIILQKINNTDVCDKVVEITNIPVYEPVNFSPVYFATVDGFVTTNGNRFGERMLKLNDDEVELIYRENSVKHISLEEELQNLKNGDENNGI